MMEIMPSFDNDNRNPRVLIHNALVFRGLSYSYHKLPKKRLKLSILKLDGSSFGVEVSIKATVADLKLALEEFFSLLPKDERCTVSWSHVWGHFCLCYEGQKLLDDKVYIQRLGIKDGDQPLYCTSLAGGLLESSKQSLLRVELKFVRHVTINYRPARQQITNQSDEPRRSVSIAHEDGELGDASNCDLVKDQETNINESQCEAEDSVFMPGSKLTNFLRVGYNAYINRVRGFEPVNSKKTARATHAMTEKKQKGTKMASSQLKTCESNQDDRRKAVLDDQDESGNLTREQFRCLALYQHDSPKLGERSSWKRYRPWRHERNHRSARLEKQLKALEDRIDKQLKRFQAQYTRASNSTLPKDVAKLLMPKPIPPLELATLSWLGDWRPSSILGFLSSLIRSSPTLASPFTHAGATEKAISQLIHDLRIEEAVIDEEFTEIQANCILNLPFALDKGKPSGSTLDQFNSELKKVHRLIVKAQNLRTNALETVVKKILCQSDAAEFLVAFSGIQETVHQFSKDYKLREGPVCVPSLGLTAASQ